MEVIEKRTVKRLIFDCSWKSPKFKCNVCKEYFTGNKPDYQEERKQAEDLTKKHIIEKHAAFCYKCDKCNGLFTSNKEMMEHRRTHKKIKKEEPKKEKPKKEKETISFSVSDLEKNSEKKISKIDSYLSDNDIPYEGCESKEWAGDMTYYETQYEIDITDLDSEKVQKLRYFLDYL